MNADQHSNQFFARLLILQTLNRPLCPVSTKRWWYLDSTELVTSPEWQVNALQCVFMRTGTVVLYMFLMRMCAEDRSHDRLHGHDVLFLTIASLFQSYTNVMN